MTNPRSFKPTDLFVITTLDTDGKSKIDEGFNKQATMTIIGEIPTVDVVPSNFVNGFVNTYTMTISSPIPILLGDRLKFKFPADIVPPADSTLMNCQGRDGLKVDCQITGRDVIVTFTEVANKPGGGNYGFSFDNVGNPFSTKTSGGFEGIKLETAEPYYPISAYGQPTAGITNKFSAPLKVYSTN